MAEALTSIFATWIALAAVATSLDPNMVPVAKEAAIPIHVISTEFGLNLTQSIDDDCLKVGGIVGRAEVQNRASEN